MNAAVKAAQSALVKKGALTEMLKSVAPLYANVLDLTSDLQDELDEEQGAGSFGLIVPVWKALDELDELVSALESVTDKEMQDADSDLPRSELKEQTTILVKHLRNLSDWAEKNRKITAALADEADELSLPDLFTAVRDSAFTAAMGLEDTILSEEWEHHRGNQNLLNEMRKLAGIERRVLEEDNKETIRQVMDVSAKYEAFLKKALGKAFKLKTPHLTKGKNTVMVAWKTAKPKGGFMGAYVSLEITYEPGRDLYDVETAYLPADTGSAVSGTSGSSFAKRITHRVNDVHVETLQNPSTLLHSLIQKIRAVEAPKRSTLRNEEAETALERLKRLAGIEDK